MGKSELIEKQHCYLKMSHAARGEADKLITLKSGCTPICPQEPWETLPRPYSSTELIHEFNKSRVTAIALQQAAYEGEVVNEVRRSRSFSAEA